MTVHVKLISYRNPNRSEWDVPLGSDSSAFGVGGTLDATVRGVYLSLHGIDPEIFANTELKGVSALVGGQPMAPDAPIRDGGKITFIEVITGG